MRVTLHKSIPLIVAFVTGAIALVVALALGLTFESLTVQLGLFGLSVYPLAVFLEWLAINR